MMSEERLRDEMRIAAIEYQISRVYNMCLAFSGVSEADIKNAEDAGLLEIGTETLQGSDPVMADHMIGEFQDALRNLLSSAREMRAHVRLKAGF